MASNQGTAAHPGTHLLLLHHTEDQRRTGVVAWLRRGLRRGAKLLYTEPADAGGRSLRALVESPSEAHEALERGQLEIFEASEQTYDPDWQLRQVQQALDAGFPVVAWSAEASTAWSVMSPEDHLELERNADVLCRTVPLAYTCQYPGEQPADRLGTVCSVHGGGLTDTLLRAHTDGEEVVLAGEVDVSNRAVLTTFLDVTTSDLRPNPLVLDLSDLDFVDAGGVRALMTGTHRFRHRGGSVRLRDPRRHVERVARLVLCTPAHGFSMEPA